MILVFDVGNTETTIGLFDGESLRGHWRIVSGIPRTVDEFGVTIRGLLALDGLTANTIDGAALGSVVPAVTEPLAAACRRMTDGPVVIIDAKAPLPIRVDVDEPLTVGADRLINTLAASRLFGLVGFRVHFLNFIALKSQQIEALDLAVVVGQQFGEFILKLLRLGKQRADLVGGRRCFGKCID